MFRIRLAAVAILIAGAVLGFLVFQSETQENAFLPETQFGLDLEGGTHLVYEADTSEIGRTEVDQAMNALRNVIEQRVNAFGVSEPLVQTETAGFGENRQRRLIVELPGVKDVEAAKDAIGKTPVLEFKLVKENETPPQRISTSSATIQTQAGTTSIPVRNTGALEDTGLTGRFLTDAQLQFGGGQGFSNEPTVLVEFNQEGTEMFAEITGENVGRQLAIYLDGRLLSAPVLREEIPSGQAQISGDFTAEEARELVRNLDLGALPVPIDLVTEQTIGAALGEETKNAGINAGIIGLIALAIFLLVWYRLPGLIAVGALGIYLIIMLTLFKVIPVTLTSAGIAGFILSIGMAVDANVLIFERMKEELRDDSKEELDMQKAIRDGFQRAWLSIRDANISSIITAIILFYLVGTALTKGFALTFGLGVLISMLSAISVSRTFLLAVAGEEYTDTKRLLYGSGFDTTGAGSSTGKDANEND